MIRDGFDEIVEEYMLMLGGFDNINLANDVISEMSATYLLTDTEIKYIKAKCEQGGDFIDFGLFIIYNTSDISFRSFSNWSEFCTSNNKWVIARFF